MKTVASFASVLLVMAVPALAGSPPTRGNAEPSALRQVKRVFIEKMDNGFDRDLQIQITRQFKGDVNVVLDRDLADAILVATTRPEQGGIGKSTLKYMGLDSSATGAITLLDKTGKTILWAEEAGDRAPWATGQVNDTGRRAMAQRLIRKLKSAMSSR